MATRAQAVVSALFTDLYEVTMAQAYLHAGMAGQAVFEAFFRRLPSGRSYGIAAGLEDVLDFLEDFHFEREDLAYLRSLGSFSDDFLRQLADLRFTGEVWAMPEGTVVFPNEPMVQVVAPIVEAQLAETFILNQLHLQSVIASKAARVVGAAQGRTVVEFGARRAHGTDAALKVARASYLAGAAGTSNLLAARTYEMPAFGTMAHSFVQAFESELAAFEAFVRLYPGTTLLVDTYDTLGGVSQVIRLAKQLGSAFKVGAIRLDSGDLEALSKAARAELDAADLTGVKIFASSDLDEHRIAELLEEGSPIDGFGVGTRLSIASDAPTLDMAYKLVEYEGRGRTKLSMQKAIYPGRKQVFRRMHGGTFAGDVLAQQGEHFPGEPLLVPVMKNGRRTFQSQRGLADARSHARAQIAALPSELRELNDPRAPYPVQVSPQTMNALERLQETLLPK